MKNSQRPEEQALKAVQYPGLSDHHVWLSMEIGRSIFDMENTRLFFDMIDRRCSKEGPNCMIFTSNLTPDKWRDFFREEDSLLCALDRTFDAATVYLMKGESYRGRNLKTYSIEISDPTE